MGEPLPTKVSSSLSCENISSHGVYSHPELKKGSENRETGRGVA
jgi:hypothetical protein